MLIALALVGCHSQLVGRPFPDGPDSGIVVDSDSAVIDTGGPPDTDIPIDEEPLPAPPYLGGSTIAAIADDIDDILSGTTRGVRIVDAENGQIIYEYDPDEPLTPASNTKLFTTATAMGQLGDDHRLRMEAWSPAAPDGSGAVSRMTVRIDHDSTWSGYFYTSAQFPADMLAESLYAAGVRRITGTLTLDGEVLVNGDSLGYYDEDDERGSGIDVLESAFEDRGITVGTMAVVSDFATPTGTLLAAHDSPPLTVVCHPIDVYSHNEMADILAHHNGLELWDASTYADGEDAALDFVSGLGIDTSGMNFDDGSGLSHGNKVTATQVTELLLAMYHEPSGQAWERTFSISGVIGTIGSRLTGSDTVGRVYAKTGSLSDTIALSGVLYSKYDGHRYVFSILQNDVTNQTTARALADDVVEVIADDLRGTGGQVGAPTLLSAVNLGDGSVELAWTGVSGASGYGVWVSADGLVWDRSDAIVELETSHVLDSLPRNAPTYVRVMAFDAESWSEPSDVYAVTPSTTLSRVLVVDGEDRWENQGENTRGAGHDFVRSAVEAMPRLTVDSAANEAVIDGDVDLLGYDAVIWLLGEESTDDATFDSDEQDLVADYLDSGGNLLVSGGEIGWDLDSQGDASSRAFYSDRLHASYAGDDAGTFTTVALAGGIFAGLDWIEFYTPARLVVDYPDQLAPENGADSELEYYGGAGGTAAISYSGAYKVVNFGFPIESIDGKDRRTEVMDRIFDFFEM